MKKKIIISVICSVLILALIGSILAYNFSTPFKKFFNKNFNIKTEETQTASGSNSEKDDSVNIEDLQNKLELTIAELESTKAELEQVELEKAETVETLTAEKSELETNLVKKTQELEEAKAELEQQIADYSVLLDEKESVETELNVANSHITTLQSDLDQTNSDLETANSNIETLTARKIELETLLAESNEANAELETELASVNSELETANKTNAELTAKKTELETDLAEEHAQVETLTADLETANANLEEKTAEVLELSSQVSSLTAEKTNLENEVAEKQATIDDLNAQIVILNAKIEEYEAALNEYDPSREYYYNILGKSTSSHTLPNGDILLSVADTKTKGLYYINSVDYSVTKIFADGSYWNTYTVLDNSDILITSTNASVSGVLLYYAENKTVSSLTSSIVQPILYELSTGSYVFYSTGSYSYYFNIKDYTCVELADSYYIEGILELSNKNILLVSGTQGTGTKIYDYDTLEVVASNSNIIGYCYPYESASGEVLIYTNRVFYIYNVGTNDFTEIFSSSTSTVPNRFYELSNGNYLFFANSGYVNFFNRTAGTVTATSSYSTESMVYEELSNGQVFVAYRGTSANSSYGYYFLDINDGSTKVSAVRFCSYSLSGYLDIGTGFLFCSYSNTSSNRGTFYYNYSDGTVTQIHTTYDFYFYKFTDDKVLFAAYSSGGFGYYDFAAAKYTSVQSNGRYDTFEELSDGTIKLSSSAWSDTVIFNPQTLSIVL